MSEVDREPPRPADETEAPPRPGSVRTTIAAIEAALAEPLPAISEADALTIAGDV